MKKKEHEAALNVHRNYGIDLLRILMMLYILILHLLTQGGILANASGVRFWVSSFLMVFVYAAVDCYAVISGYVSYSEEDKPLRYERYVPLWLQVFFYSAGITFIMYLLYPDAITVGNIIRSMFPVSSFAFWYFSSYTGLFVLMPWINKFVRALSNKEMNRFIGVVFLVFSCFGTCASVVEDPFRFGGGYTFIWLVVMYVFGAWMKKCDIPSKINTKVMIAAVFCVIVILGVVRCFGNSLFISYISPFMVLIALAYVCLFSKIKINTSFVNIIKFISPAVFGVYLLHVHKIIFDVFLKDAFSWIADSTPFVLLCQIFGCAFIIFVICILVEKVRSFLFEVFGINRLVTKVFTFITGGLKKCIDNVLKE